MNLPFIEDLNMIRKGPSLLRGYCPSTIAHSWALKRKKSLKTVPYLTSKKLFPILVPYLMEEIFKKFETMQKPPQLSPQTQEESKRCSLPYTKVLFYWLYISRRDYITTLLTRNSEQLCKGVISN